MDENKTETQLLRENHWIDIEDIRMDIKEFLNSNHFHYSIQGDSILIYYHPDNMPRNRDIIGLIQYIIFQLEGRIVVDGVDGHVRIRFRVKKNGVK